MAYDDYNTPDWNQFLNSNQPMVPNPQMMQPNQQTPASTYPAVDYRAQLQSMLTPYQNMAQQYSQPYNAFQPGSLLGKILPGGVQQRLSNGILVGSMIPQGQTAGQNISGVMQGLVGANQFERQRAMQGAMMPYEVAGQQVKLEDELAQVQQRQQAIPLDYAREMAYIGQADRNAKYMQQPNPEQQRLSLAAAAAGVPGFTGDFSKVNPSQAQAIQEELNKQQMRMTAATSGLTPGHITQMQMDASGLKPGTQAYADKAQKTYMSLMAGTAGASASSRTTAEQDVKQPQVDVDSEVKLAQTENIIPKPLTSSQFDEQNKYNPEYLKDPQGMYKGYLNQAVPQYNQQKAAYDSKVSQYRDAARKNPSLRWHDFVQQSASQNTSPTVPSNRPPGW